MRIEEKLANLARCGLALRPEFSVDTLLSSWDRESLEEPGYELALVSLGMDGEEPPHAPLADNVWHFDAECIEDDQAYAEIAWRLAHMTGGSLALSEIKSAVDFEEEEAWLEFRCGGEKVRIELDVDDDWVDVSVFTEFVRLLAKHDPGKIYFIYGLEGQDFVLGCITKAQFRELLRIVPDAQLLE